MPAKERRQAILEAVQGLFVKKGFDGTTSREMARAAGVSEALLYKHFPDKDAIYAAMRDSTITDELVKEYGRILDLPPSSKTLVLLAQFFISNVIKKRSNRADMSRLLVRSLLEDGKFALTFYSTITAGWLDQFEKSFAAAQKSGDAVSSPIEKCLFPVLIYSLCSGLSLHLDQPEVAKKHQESKDELVERCTWFILMGIGLKPAVIRRHYRQDGIKALLGK